MLSKCHGNDIVRQKLLNIYSSHPHQPVWRHAMGTRCRKNYCTIPLVSRFPDACDPGQSLCTTKIDFDELLQSRVAFTDRSFYPLHASRCFLGLLYDHTFVRFFSAEFIPLSPICCTLDMVGKKVLFPAGLFLLDFRHFQLKLQDPTQYGVSLVLQSGLQRASIWHNSTFHSVLNRKELYKNNKAPPCCKLCSNKRLEPR